MRFLIALSLFALSAPPALAQTEGSYQFPLTADQVVPGPGVLGQVSGSASVSVETTPTGPTLTFFGASNGIFDVTELTIHGPATATTTGPILESIPFLQQANSTTVIASLTDYSISTATRDIILSGQAYVEIRSLLNPSGALRGAIFTNTRLCLPQPSGSPTCVGCPVPPACSLCPCDNAPFSGTFAGCRNSQGTSARLFAVGLPALSADSLDFLVDRASPNSIALLISGSVPLPLASGICSPGAGVTGALTDGLRCIGGQVLRHSVQPTDADGAIAPGAFVPAGGLLGQSGFMAGQSRVFQVFYSDPAGGPCGAGRNTTPAALVSFVL